MKVNIDLLNLKTVDEAIKQIEAYQKRVANLIPDFLKACAEAVRDKANSYIGNFGYDSETVSAIQNGWQPIKKGNPVVLENAYDRAVYIEFGTGIVGSNEAHEQASESGYEYDVNAHGEKGWSFIQDIDDLMVDLPHGKYKTHLDEKRHIAVIRTSGAPATMFLFQSAMDFFEVDKGHERIWKELTKDL